jgi:DNA-binding protein H-NS
MASSDLEMTRLDIEAMSLDELWSFHERIVDILSSRMTAEKQELEQRLDQLRRGQHKGIVLELDRTQIVRPVARRSYPQVLPKYQNPSDPSETWSGRGKQPRWLVSALKAGARIEDFLIARVDARARVGQ